MNNKIIYTHIMCNDKTRFIRVSVSIAIYNSVCVGNASLVLHRIKPNVINDHHIVVL